MTHAFAVLQLGLVRVRRMTGALLLAIVGSAASAHAALLTLTCTAPASMAVGGSTNIICTGTSEQHRPLTYSFATTMGTITAHGASATFLATGPIAGTATIVAMVRDDRGDTATQRYTIAIHQIVAERAMAPTAAAPAPEPKHEAIHEAAVPVPEAAIAPAPAVIAHHPAPPAPAAPVGDDDHAIVDWVNGLPFGHITDNIASYTAMRLNVPYTVMVTIGGSDVNLAAPAGAPAPAALHVSKHMDVELTSAGSPGDFTIVPVDAAQNPRIIVSNASTTWSWTVTPKNLGQLKLDVAAYVLYGDNQENRISYETYNRSVVVKSVTLWGYLTDGLEYVLENPGASLKYMLPGGGGATIIALLYAWWKKRRNSQTGTGNNKSEKTEGKA